MPAAQDFLRPSTTNRAVSSLASAYLRRGARWTGINVAEGGFA